MCKCDEPIYGISCSIHQKGSIVSIFKRDLFFKSKDDEPREKPSDVNRHRPEERRAPAPLSEADSYAFSAMELRDRVVIMLLFEQVVQIEDVERAWKDWMAMGGERASVPLWRVLLINPTLDRQKIFAQAARVYAFENAQISQNDTPDFLREVRDRFTESQWQRLIELCLLPIDREQGRYERDPRWIFATYDPAAPEVKALLQEMGLGRYEVRYAPQSLLVALQRAAKLPTNAAQEWMDFEVVASPEEEAEEGVEEASSEAEQESLGTLADEVSHHTYEHIFEDALVAAVRDSADGVRFAPAEDGKVEITLRFDEAWTLWAHEERVHAEGMMAYISDNILKVDPFKPTQIPEGIIQRWIEESLIRFRVSMPQARGVQAGQPTQQALIDLLDRRKMVATYGRLSTEQRG